VAAGDAAMPPLAVQHSHAAMRNFFKIEGPFRLRAGRVDANRDDPHTVHMERPNAPQSNGLSHRPLFTTMLAASLLAPALALAQAHGDPDWPCQQIKISELSLAAVWSGPPVDLRDDRWKDNPAVADMVEKLAPRRQPIEQMQTLLHDFAEHAGPDKQAQLLQIFVGVFTVLDGERDSVISGLDRFGARQKHLAADIRGDNETLRSLQNDPAADPKAVQQMTQKVAWEVEVFQDRRQALSYTCDVPSKIEQRLFAVAREIQQDLE
jgi:hypothetical protein